MILVSNNDILIAIPTRGGGGVGTVITFFSLRKRNRTEIPLHLTDSQVNSIEPIDGHVLLIRGHRWKKSGGKLFGIPFMAIAGPPVEQRWPPVGMENFREKSRISHMTWPVGGNSM